MFKKISQRPYSILVALKNGYKKQIRLNFRLSLLSALIGIFLLPHLAYLSAITPEEIIALTNQTRETAGLKALTANQLLTQAAIAKGRAILKSQTFKHNIDNKKFSSWIRDVGYNYSYVGENLAIDFLTSQTVVEAWENSLRHKKNLLSPYYREIGVAATQGKFQDQDTTVVVQIFGSPAVGSAQLLAPNPGFRSNNLNMNFLQTDLTGYQPERAENLLTHSIINQELLPTQGNKLTLPTENNLMIKANKFIVRPEAYAATDNFLIIFMALTLIYFLVFLYYYYFLKINRLAAA